jgi:CHAT domain-containing protein
LEKALEITKEAVGEEHPDYALSLNNLAALYDAMGDYTQARPLLEKALEITREALGEKHPHYALSLNSLAWLYAKKGDYRRARPLLEKALEIRKDALGEKHPQYATSLYNLALLLAATGDSSRSADLAIHAEDVSQQHLDRSFTTLNEQQRHLLLADTRVYLDVLLSLRRSASLSTSHLYDRLLAWRGIIEATHAEEQLERDRPALATLFRDLREARAGLSRLVNNPPAPAFRADWLNRWEAFQTRKDRAEAALARESVEFRQQRKQQQPTSAMVAAALPKDSVFLDFFEYGHGTPPAKKGERGQVERRLLAFVVAQGNEVTCVDLGTSADIEQAVQAWRKPLVSRGTAVDVAAGATLRRLVWQPLVKLLGESKTILVASDGPLCYLPLAALPGETPGSFLLEEYTIAHLTSGRHLLHLAEPAVPPPASEGLLAVGGLDYGPASSRRSSPLADLPAQWKALPGSKVEVEHLAALYRKSFPTARSPVVHTSTEADTTVLSRDLTPTKENPRFRYLHLATHGHYAPPKTPPRNLHPGLLSIHDLTQAERVIHDTNPLLRTYVALSGANSKPETGIWRGLEVSNLDLRGVEVVVLSACHSGEGKVIAGEGMLGLQRAFAAAGARNLVSSLWAVGDAATSLLMEEFYRQLWLNKQPPLQALRQAQLFVLNHPEKVKERQEELKKAGVRDFDDEAVVVGLGKGKERTPVALWAPFVLSGGIEPSKPKTDKDK